MTEIPERFMVWHSMPNLSHIGTWATKRYPEEAVEAVRADTISAPAQPSVQEAAKNPDVADLINAAEGLVDFHNGPNEAKRPDVYLRHMKRIARALRTLASEDQT